MAKKDYIPVKESELSAWLEHYKKKLPVYKDILKLTDEEIQEQIDVSNAFIEKRKTHTDAKTAAKSTRAAFTAQKKKSLEKIRKLVKNIKTRNPYDQSIGKDIGVVGAERVINPDKLKPTLKAAQQAQGIVIKYKKKTAHGINIYRNEGAGFVFAGYDANPPFVDKTKLPEGAASAIWEYYGIYVISDKEVGSRSDRVSLAVKNIIS